MNCSELTNFRYSTDLSAKTDALFTREWMPDTNTFSALVKSSVLDIFTCITCEIDITAFYWLQSNHILPATILSLF